MSSLVVDREPRKPVAEDRAVEREVKESRIPSGHMQEVHETAPGKDLQPPLGGRGRRQAGCPGPRSERSQGQSPAPLWSGEETRGWRTVPKSSPGGEFTKNVVPPKGKAREPLGQKWGFALENCPSM